MWKMTDAESDNEKTQQPAAQIDLSKVFLNCKNLSFQAESNDLTDSISWYMKEMGL